MLRVKAPAPTLPSTWALLQQSTPMLPKFCLPVAQLSGFEVSRGEGTRLGWGQASHRASTNKPLGACDKVWCLEGLAQALWPCTPQGSVSARGLAFKVAPTAPAKAPPFWAVNVFLPSALSFLIIVLTLDAEVVQKIMFLLVLNSYFLPFTAAVFLYHC